MLEMNQWIANSPHSFKYSCQTIKIYHPPIDVPFPHGSWIKCIKIRTLATKAVGHDEESYLCSFRKQSFWCLFWNGLNPDFKWNCVWRDLGEFWSFKPLHDPLNVPQMVCCSTTKMVMDDDSSQISCFTCAAVDLTCTWSNWSSMMHCMAERWFMEKNLRIFMI